ncbi:Calcyclin-binding protein [Pelomyxa schiedti]|nr:Calcyclin-binding protein [Pelomyxa schiedti]
MEQDIAELRSLVSQATRPHVVQFINAEIDRLSALVPKADAPATPATESTTPAAVDATAAPTASTVTPPAATTSTASAAAVPAPVLLAVKPATHEVMYKAISNFAWDQSSGVVTIYIPLPGIGAHPRDKIGVQFETSSMCVTIMEFRGENLRLSIRKLNKPINPTSSTFSVTSSRLVVKMRMQEQAFWSSLEWKEERKPKVPKMEDKDPSKGLMEMMKNLYDDGDDEMKRMIAKTWTESQDKKREGPGKHPSAEDDL